MEKFRISRARRLDEAPSGLRRAFPHLFVKERGRESHVSGEASATLVLL